MVSFNVFTSVPRGVYPPIPMAKADTYNLMMTQSQGPRSVAFNHINDRDETIVMIEGSYSTRVNTNRVTLNTGDVLVIKKGTPHGDIETGPQGYKALQIESNTDAATEPTLN
ncbi:MAG: cupin domain-containing protein [Cyanobacteria bacterium]|nr:cupin domain-containing protein [Cyanobacteriota bacterium]